MSDIKPITVTITSELEYEYMIRARCIRLFGEICNLADECTFGELTESIDSAEQADQLLDDFTVARDALLRLTLGTTVPDYPPNE